MDDYLYHLVCVVVDDGGKRVSDEGIEKGKAMSADNSVVVKKFRDGWWWAEVRGEAPVIGQVFTNGPFATCWDAQDDARDKIDVIEYGVDILRPSDNLEVAEVRDGFPVKAGWNYSKCGERYYQSTEEAFRMRALEDLYTAVDRGGGGIKLGKDVENRKRCQQLLNELAVELVGGIPEGYEEFT